jgi:hypothetical protein
MSRPMNYDFTFTKMLPNELPILISTLYRVRRFIMLFFFH